MLQNGNGSAPCDFFTAFLIRGEGGIAGMSSADRENGMSLRVELTSLDQPSVGGEHRVEWCQSLAEGSVDLQLLTLVDICQHSNVSGVCDPVIRLAGCRTDSLRSAAAQSLEGSVQPSVSEVPALIALLSDQSDSEISYWAATLLGRLGPQAVDATQSLCDCLQDSSFLPAKERAAWALMEIGPTASDAIPVLQSVCESAPARLHLLCHRAMKVIGTMGSLVAQRAA